MLTVTTNAALVAAELDKGVQKLPAASSAIGKAVGGLVLEETTRAMQEAIYDQPLPPSYALFGLSDRTGALLAGETLVTRGDHERVVTTENTGWAGKDPTLYAEERHRNARYPAPWRDMGQEVAEPQIPALAEDVLIENMPPGLVTK